VLADPTVVEAKIRVAAASERCPDDWRFNSKSTL